MRKCTCIVCTVLALVLMEIEREVDYFVSHITTTARDYLMLMY